MSNLGIWGILGILRVIFVEKLGIPNNKKENSMITIGYIGLGIMFQSMLEMDMAELDNSAVIGIIEALPGTKLAENASDS